MTQPALLQIQGETDGAWRVQLGDGDNKLVTARLAPEQCAALIAAIREDLRAPLVVVEDGDDVARSRRELRAGQRLGAVFGASSMAARLSELLTQARLEGVRLALAVDADRQEIQSLPWELLAIGPEGAPLEESGGAVIRLAAALSVARSSPRGGRLRVLLGCPTPADPFCSAVIAGLRALLVRLGLDAPMLIDPLADGRLPPAVSDCVDVLHYVCHGDFLHDAFLLQGGERPHLPGVLVGQVADDLGRLPLVVLDVCGAGDPGLAPLTTLVGQMLQGSAQAVVAPARAALVGASQAFSQGLYRALGRGASVVQAVVEGRSQVRTLAHPHPSARAANLLLSVSRLSTLRAAPPLESGWVPEGWPRPDAELRALLGRARLLARNEESGHVGIEHLVRSARAGEGGTLNARLRIVRDRLELNLRSVAVPSVGRADCVATPRLRGLLKGAPEGVGLEDLWRALVSDPDHGLHALARLPLALLILPPPRGMPTPPGLGSPARRPPATALQLIWGPMDGWILRPQPGQTLGRASAAVGPDLPIYPPDHTEEDIALSRRHLAWQGPGRVQILRAVRHVKLGDSEEDAPVVESGILALDVGDLLILTQHTWLRGVGP